MDKPTLSAERTAEPRTELSAREVLIAARKLIEKRKNWMQGLYWAVRSGRQYHGVDDPNEAKCFCAWGALCKAAGRHYSSYLTDLPAKRALQAAMGDTIESFNDANKRTHAEVLAAFDQAIAQCAVGDRESDATGTAGA